MTVVPRTEIRRMQVVSLLGVVLGVTVLGVVVATYGDAPALGRAGLLLLGAVAVAAILAALIQLFSHRSPSQAIIFRKGDQTVVATNQLHAGFKLRFFRDVLGEYMVAFSDEERERWKALEQVGFHPVFNFYHVRKTLVLPLSFMVFDQVFVMDHTNRWDYFDCRNTSEPAFSERGVGPFADDSVLLDINKADRQTT